MIMSELISRIRSEIGDPLQPFLTTTLGDGFTEVYDLPKMRVDSLTVNVQNGAQLTTLNPATDYSLDTENGIITLTNAVPFGASLIMQGQAWGLFTDDELAIYLNDSINQHTFNRTIDERTRTRQGFITYRRIPMELSNLPMIEEPLLIMLCTINVMWVLANDAATDANVQTAEGTNIDRISRYQQLMGHIADLQERYEKYCGELNVGAFRMETLKLRRVSRTTGRLVPVYVDREYDEHVWPRREVPPIDGQWEDNSGVPSPLWNAQGF